MVRKNIKAQKKKYLFNKREERNRKNKLGYSLKKRNQFKPIRVVVSPPQDFRLLENTSEVLKFYQIIINYIKSCKNKLRIFFDLNDIRLLSVDSVMYLLALLRNLKEKAYRDISFSGNSPTNEEARIIFQESGFLNYVNSKDSKIKPSSKKIQILTGKDNDSTVARDLCDFVNNINGSEKSFTFDLYAVLVELMGNTRDHAYSNSDIFLIKEWYVFAEERDSEISFVFLDTGQGIPSTVNKKFGERLMKVLNMDSISDSEFIKSALEGKQRTKTKKKNRGMGLPRVVEACIDGNLESVKVISGKGSCEISKKSNEPILCKEFEGSFNGTLLSWKICLERKVG